MFLTHLEAARPINMHSSINAKASSPASACTSSLASQGRLKIRSGGGAMAWPELLAQRFSLLRSCLSSLYSDFRRDGAHTSPAPLKIRGSATPSLHLLPHGTSGKEAELLKNGKKKQDLLLRKRENFFSFSFSHSVRKDSEEPCRRARCSR